MVHVESFHLAVALFLTGTLNNGLTRYSTKFLLAIPTHIHITNTATHIIWKPLPPSILSDLELRTKNEFFQKWCHSLCTKKKNNPCTICTLIQLLRGLICWKFNSLKKNSYEQNKKRK